MTDKVHSTQISDNDQRNTNRLNPSSFGASTENLIQKGSIGGDDAAAQQQNHLIIEQERRGSLMNPVLSPQIYPRLDKHFKSKKSLNFDMMKSKIMIERGRPRILYVWHWISYAIIGICTGLIAFMMEMIELYMVKLRNKSVDYILIHSSLADNSSMSQLAAWAFCAAFCFILAALASYFTVTMGPGANGSGIAELFAYLNGVNYPKLIGWDTLIVKSIAVVVGISAQLCIGKEGPLAHIGANVGIILIYTMPVDIYKYFQNDVHKREFAAAGIACGVSAAFGSPIGGTLFAYEISQPSTFWNFGMIWRIFFCSAVSTWTLSSCDQIYEGGIKSMTLSASGTLKFGQLTNATVKLQHILGSIIIGVIGGLLGSFFIFVNGKMGKWRKKYITTTSRKVIEAGMYGAATMSVCIVFIASHSSCQTINSQDKEVIEVNNFQTWTCGKDINGKQQINPLASLFFNTEGNAIKTLFDTQEVYEYSIYDLSIFSLVWYGFTIITYGIWMPAGLFLPGIIMGGTIGRLYSRITWEIFGIAKDNKEAQQNALLGATAMLSGYCRLTYSLQVMMLETASAINMYIPLLICMMFSYGTALYFNKSLYFRALRTKQVSFLHEKVPKINRDLKAKIIMCPDPMTLHLVPKVSEIQDCLRSGHNTFPLLNKHGLLVGQISSNFLIILIENQHWYLNKLQHDEDDEIKDEIDLGGNKSKTLNDMSADKDQSTDHGNAFGQENQLLLEDDLTVLKRKKTNYKIDKSLAPELIVETQNLMDRVSKVELGCSEKDYEEIPMTNPKLDWWNFNCDVFSTDKSWKDVAGIMADNRQQRIDLRPYMIENPTHVYTTDSLQNILDVFRFKNSRQICVVNPVNGKIKGVIGREDIFSYMSL